MCFIYQPKVIFSKPITTTPAALPIISIEPPTPAQCNMLGGTELIRRKLGKDAHAMTITLLLNSEGKKMGKTAAGAVWLDPNKTSPYDFYQYWRNVTSTDVKAVLDALQYEVITND